MKGQAGEFMTIELLIEFLKGQKAFLNSSQYGYMEIIGESLGSNISFADEAQLDKFVNSKSDDNEQIVLKAFNGKKTLFIAAKEYDVILIYDGYCFVPSQFWKRENKKIESKPINLEKLKTEIHNHFTTVKNQKLAS